MPRPDLFVIARFLDILHQVPEGVPRRRLQGAVRLNYDLYRRYLALMLERGWVEVAVGKDGAERVGLTPLGAAAHARLVGWIRDSFGDMRL